jgi:2-phosphosulfolactate phosphatase
MDIHRLSCRAGAEAARGIAVIIDVFRAFTCEPLMLRLGASEIILEADIDRCRQVARAGNRLLVGEKDEVPIEGFDFGNSPSQILAAGPSVFAGRGVVHRTTAGVTGALIAMERAQEVLLASFLNAAATARYIRQCEPSVVSIVGMGVRTLAPAPEDERCGDYIESLLTNSDYDHIDAVANILAADTAQRFLRGDKAYLPREDPVYCLQRDLFDRPLRAERREDLVMSVPIGPATR